MPDSIQTINNPENLEPFLINHIEGYRVWGIFRLGQIGSEPDIDRLLQLYETEPYRPPVGTPHGLSDGVKYHSIIAISNIGGPRALSEVLNIAEGYGTTQDSDSSITLRAICHALGRFSGDESYDKLRNYYENVNLDRIVREIALSRIYLHDLRNPDYATPSDSVEYLFNEISNNFSSNLLNIENYIITQAVSHVFYIEINNPDIASELSDRVAYIQDDEDLKKHLQAELNSMNQRLID
jgi:hypothetical protein